MRVPYVLSVGESVMALYSIPYSGLMFCISRKSMGLGFDFTLSLISLFMFDDHRFRQYTFITLLTTFQYLRLRLINLGYLSLLHKCGFIMLLITKKQIIHMILNHIVINDDVFMIE